MSASLYWIPLNVARQHLEVWSGSSFVSAMDRAFGASPWRLGSESLERLRGMAALYANGERENPFTVLVDAIENGGESRIIEVWPEY